ncbi:VPLPA-CTERM sorting domain-containing protein [Jannaschia sp. CCS1]|uniref:VPLPA-CTERM sorting domain-containing protein n=1 Tax=Jannaschia sp. (strain CCS1) TaxID=290400 RepID=UPI000053DE09|nr:VPLPA-CTERM sorting domain-containing protein [Jannaschia sp. CCS1]ABD55590.1 protein of unknown function DUF1555 [Jannaschia sp. CCS1]
MRVLRGIAAGIVALGLAAGAANANTVSIDFEDFSGFYAPTFDFGGVSFQSVDPNQSMQVGRVGALGAGQSGHVLRSAVPPFGAEPRGGSFGGTFLGTTVSFLSLVAGDSGGDLDIFNLQGFDANGSLVSETGELRSNAATLLSIQGAGIASFLLTIGDLPDNDGSSVVDNFTFTQEVAAVPLPASLPLLGVGALALGVVARRRRHRAAQA